jgi:hypothetical protein
MSDLFLCSIEDTFQVTGRGLMVAPQFAASEYCFAENQRVRVVLENGRSFECRASFQIPHQTPAPKILSYCCALLDVAKDSVPVGSQLWLLGKEEQEI